MIDQRDRPMCVHNDDVVDVYKRELEKIEVALREPQTEERYIALYAAQQALCWAINPVGFESPYRTIQHGLVRPLTGIQEAPVSYPVYSDPHSS
ncbi:MAG TPA: hypothetical protein VGI93_13890 [Steroidobacteraceae bacterium]|jgi:hypothetical protein